MREEAYTVISVVDAGEAIGERVAAMAVTLRDRVVEVLDLGGDVPRRGDGESEACCESVPCHWRDAARGNHDIAPPPPRLLHSFLYAVPS